MKKLALAAVLALTTACASVEDERFDDFVSEVVSVDELLMKSDGTLSLDMRQPGIGYRLSQGTDLSRINLVCPNGQSMHMEAWLADRRAEFGVSFQESETGFVIMPSKNAQAQSAAVTSGLVIAGDGCPAGCYLCTDGLCVCD